MTRQYVFKHEFCNPVAGWGKPLVRHLVQEKWRGGAPAFAAAMPILSQLLKAEMAEREVRSIAYHMKAGRFPAYKDLSRFAFAASEVNEALVGQLHRCEFTDAAENVVLIGRPGTETSHVAVVLKARLWRDHWHPSHPASPQTRALLLDGRVGQCAGAGKPQCKAGKIAEMLVKTDLLVLDELGYPLSAPSVSRRVDPGE